ncbi:MAG: DUF4153 domain-containing protein [Fibromonadaceae bacterium]|nr:DUF4153 domain-containing protein [Fibromonadaceae bacterium]
MLIIGFACCCFYAKASAELISDQLHFFLLFGILISTAATLWLEDFVNYPKQLLITTAAILLWGIYCLFLPTKLPAGKEIELNVIGVAIFLSIFFIPFLKKNKDKAFWSFTTQTIFQLVLATSFSTIIFIGLYIALESLKALFNIKIDPAGVNLTIVCYALFAPLYFLANIPSQITKRNEEIVLNKYLKILALYILMPLAAVYALILYVYLFKIIFTFELPKGSVSWLVSTLACSGLLIITLLYPMRLEAKNKFIVFLSRYFGLLILPLLALMTIGIFRRIDDYGITVNRSYVLLANIWFYGIFIYLFITKGQRIKWIFISFATIALFVSVGFWNVSNVTKYILTAEVSRYLDGQKIGTSDKMNQADAKVIIDKIKYLRRDYGDESIRQFFSNTIDASTSLFSERERRHGERFGHYLSSQNSEIKDIGNFNAFVYLNCTFYSKDINKNIDYSFENNLLTIKIIPDNRFFVVPLKEPAQHLLKNKKVSPNEFDKMFFQFDEYIILISSFSGLYFEETGRLADVQFKGLLFYNR